VLETPSALRLNGSLEGIYLRIEEQKNSSSSTPRCLLKRCKLVRSDFLAGIGVHWAKKIPTKNRLKFG